MKKLYTLLTATFIGCSAFAQIPNAGFETWTSAGSYDLPTGWDNINALTSLASVYTCTKGTPGAPGASYLKLVSKTMPLAGAVPGVAVSGLINTTTFSPKSGFAFTSRPQSLTGNWQYMAYGADQGRIVVLLSKWNTAASKRDTVSYTNYLLPGMVMSWAPFSIPLTYQMNKYPDTAIIVLSSSGTTPVVNSYLYIDSLGFYGSVSTGISPLNMDRASVKLFPNPTSNSATLLYNSSFANSISLQITDVNGKVYLDKRISIGKGENNIPLNTSGYPKGLYLVRIDDGDDTQTEKLIIE